MTGAELVGSGSVVGLVVFLVVQRFKLDIRIKLEPGDRPPSSAPPPPTTDDAE